jgi:hypothetical protein
VSGPTTTYHNPQAKQFAWSYSKLKNYETCPKRHFHVDIAKDFKEAESEQLVFGNYVHKELAKAIETKSTLPAQIYDLQKWVDKVLTSPGNNFVEQQLAILRDYSPCPWFDKKTWFRGIGDVIKINGPVALALDWKTGKIVEDSQQLMLMAQCVFSHHPEIQAVRAEFIWLKEDATTSQKFLRADMPGHWANILPRIAQLEQANQTLTYPAKPGFLCKRWCPVTTCPHNGE